LWEQSYEKTREEQNKYIYFLCRVTETSLIYQQSYEKYLNNAIIFGDFLAVLKIICIFALSYYHFLLSI
jgi:hypothetical protein